MTPMICRYPGDPPITVTEMTRTEFLQLFPRAPIEIHTASSVKEIPMQANEIWCDGCGDDPGDYILMVGNTKAMCRRCATETYLPHCGEVQTVTQNDIGTVPKDLF